MSVPDPAPDWQSWIGRSETVEDTITLAPVEMMLATLDDDDSAPGPGDPLPPLWHWFYFLSRAPQSELRQDGLPAGLGLLPDTGLPRRMFGGCRLTFHAPLPIGTAVRRHSEVVSIQEKRGRSGRLVFVDTRHRVLGGDTLYIEEDYTAVFREAGAPSPAPEILDEVPPPPANAWVREVQATVPFLFRYSALTFNPHRIHYDRPYATEVEGYAGLVVHGPLLATLLLEVVRRNTPRRVTSFAFRATAPIYDIAPFRTQGVLADDGSVALEAVGPDGRSAMQATATLA